MRDQKIFIVAGTRPEVIKLAPVFFSLQKTNLEPTLLATGQHTTLADDAFQSFNLSPDYSWDLMEPGQTPFEFANRLSDRLIPFLERERPSLVMVQGDTTSAFVTATCADLLHIPVAHIEAGIRSGSFEEPWPEELNRRGISECASVHFAPTKIEKVALVAEGIDESTVHVTGNTVVDAMDRFDDWKTIPRDEDRVLVTIHRRENATDNFASAIRVVVGQTERFPSLNFDVVSHPNPNLKPFLDAVSQKANVRILPPCSYPEMLKRLANAAVVLTDSGGLQEEAAYTRTPVLVVRDKPDRRGGAEWIVGRDADRCTDALNAVTTGHHEFPVNPFGDGNAADRITTIIGGMIL